MHTEENSLRRSEGEVGAPDGKRARSVRTLGATYLVNLKSQIRYYTTTGWMLSALLSPIFLLASAWVIAHFLSAGGTPPRFFELTGYPDYLSFAVLGLATSGLVLSALDDGGTAVYDEETQGTWDLVALTPVNRFLWMLGKTTAGMTASLIDFFAVLVLGALAFGILLQPAGLLTAFAGLALTLVALQGFAFLMAAVGLAWKQPHALSILLSPILIFISGMMFPVQALPEWVQTVGRLFPLTHGLHVIRDGLLLGASLSDVLPALGWLVGTGAAMMVAGFVAFRRMEARALRAGGLGRY